MGSCPLSRQRHPVGTGRAWSGLAMTCARRRLDKAIDKHPGDTPEPGGAAVRPRHKERPLQTGEERVGEAPRLSMRSPAHRAVCALAIPRCSSKNPRTSSWTPAGSVAYSAASIPQRHMRPCCEMLSGVEIGVSLQPKDGVVGLQLNIIQGFGEPLAVAARDLLTQVALGGEVVVNACLSNSDGVSDIGVGKAVVPAHLDDGRGCLDDLVYGGGVRAHKHQPTRR